MGDCGSLLTDPPAFCGRVFLDGTSVPVSGATVRFKTATGADVATVVTNASGFFKLNNASSTIAQFQVDPPVSGFYAETARYAGALYAYYRPNRAGTGACIMSVGVFPTRPKDLGNVFLFPDSAAPPPPVFVCPR